MLDLPLFDIHVHLPGTDFLYHDHWERAFLATYGAVKLAIWHRRQTEARTSFLDEHGFPRPAKVQPEPEQAAELYEREAREHHLKGICIISGGGNERLAKAISGHSHLYGFAHHDPFSANAAEELETTIVKYSFRGYKILATALVRTLRDTALHPIWEICEQYELPVIIHFGPLSAGNGIATTINADPLILHDIAKGYPNVPFIIPHWGGGT